MSRDQATSWLQTALNLVAIMAFGVIAYWVHLQDTKNRDQDTAIELNTRELISAKKDIEYSKKTFESIDTNMQKLLEKVDRLSTEVAKLKP